MSKIKLFVLFFLVVGKCCFLPSFAGAIPPKEVLVIANKRVEESVALAKYYLKRRNIPEENLLVLVTSEKEEIDRTEYERWIRQPVAEKLERLNKEKKSRGELKISTIVTIYGLPLKIRADLSEGGKGKLKQKTTRAAVDSELALVLVDDYPLSGWIANPYFLPNINKKTELSKNDVLLVSRLDAPSPQIVRRMIDDGLIVEKTGLKGVGYFDARGIADDEKSARLRGGYGRYDYSLLRAARVVEEKMAVVVDKDSALFPLHSCPEAALYCGWYSLGHYIDSLGWKKGAVGYHIASAECASLHQQGAPYWCPQMLAGGVAATLGPVYEPYVEGFPLPELFFAMLVEGMSLGEAWLVSLPFISWQMVLLGDPLYQPFL